MRTLQPTEKVEKFFLVDYSRQATEIKDLNRFVLLTPSEAHDKNYSLTSNGIAKRYVKSEPRLQ